MLGDEDGFCGAGDTGGLDNTVCASDFSAGTVEIIAGASVVGRAGEGPPDTEAGSLAVLVC